MSDTITHYKPVYKTKESEENLILQIALPGVLKEHIALKTENFHLKLEATREKKAEENWNLISQTNNPDTYALEMKVNNKFDLSKAEATFEKQVLKLILPIKDNEGKQLVIQ